MRHARADAQTSRPQTLARRDHARAVAVPYVKYQDWLDRAAVLLGMVMIASIYVGWLSAGGDPAPDTQAAIFQPAD